MNDLGTFRLFLMVSLFSISFGVEAHTPKDTCIEALSNHQLGTTLKSRNLGDAHQLVLQSYGGFWSPLLGSDMYDLSEDKLEEIRKNINRKRRQTHPVRGIARLFDRYRPIHGTVFAAHLAPKNQSVDPYVPGTGFHLSITAPWDFTRQAWVQYKAWLSNFDRANLNFFEEQPVYEIQIFLTERRAGSPGAPLISESDLRLAFEAAVSGSSTESRPKLIIRPTSFGELGQTEAVEAVITFPENISTAILSPFEIYQRMYEELQRRSLLR